MKATYNFYAQILLFLKRKKYSKKLAQKIVKAYKVHKASFTFAATIEKLQALHEFFHFNELSADLSDIPLDEQHKHSNLMKTEQKKLLAAAFNDLSPYLHNENAQKIFDAFKRMTLSIDALSPVLFIKTQKVQPFGKKFATVTVTTNDMDQLGNIFTHLHSVSEVYFSKQA